MTCLEKLAAEHPEFMSGGHPLGCPSTYAYLPDDEDACQGGHCNYCWDREIPEDEPKTIGETMKIKDSGERTEFKTGAVRDLREGKGRCDLMPLEVVAKYLGRDSSPDLVIDRIASFCQSYDTEYLIGALDVFCDRHWKNRPTLILEVAKQFEDGAKKYGEDNWQKGIPAKCYIDSAIRHYVKWLRGDKDEPHDRAFVWNIMCCIWEIDHSPRSISSASNTKGTTENA